MQNFNHNHLTNGKLGANRGDVKQLSESNYLVSNDGVQTMELPRNMLGPKKHQGARSTPLLIPPIKYIVYNFLIIYLNNLLFFFFHNYIL
jgi:hypothetical protein